MAVPFGLKQCFDGHDVWSTGRMWMTRVGVQSTSWNVKGDSHYVDK